MNLHKAPVHIAAPGQPSLAHSHLRNSRLLRVRVNSLNCPKMDDSGTDSDGRVFNNAEEMWREEVGDGDPLKKNQWYSQGVGYWQDVDATVDGVLGGYGHVNEPDIKGSEEFLNSLLAERLPDAGRGRHLVALDCGSGIGRITKNLLIRYFNEGDKSAQDQLFLLWRFLLRICILCSLFPSYVDLLEPVAHFLDTACRNLAPENLMVTEDYKAVNFFCVPLQEFTPEAERYDIIWVQWCIGHLSDDDFVSFFKRAKNGLKPSGLFVLKENIARSGFVLDKEDKSITRSDLYFKQLFNQCGLHIYKMKDQKGFPEELFAVKMYALTTELPKRVNSSRSKQRRTNRPAIIK